MPRFVLIPPGESPFLKLGIVPGPRAVVYSTGGTIARAWGLHATATTETGSSTNVTEVVTIYATAPTKSGTGTITTAASIVAENPDVGMATNVYSIWAKGPVLSNGDLQVNRAGTAGSSSFLSGSAVLYYFVDIGTNGSKLRMAVAGAANDFISGSAQDDGMLFTVGSKTLWLGTGSGIGQVKITHTASAANQLVLTGAASGANASINVTAENLLFGSGSAIATTATAGYVMFPSCAGTPTGVPTGQAAGKIPMIFDTTGVKLWFYTGGAWKGVVVA